MRTLLIPLLLPAAVAHAQTFTIDWYTIDGGGNTTPSASGFSILGTIGQPDAAFLAGPTYSCQGGFWGAFASATSCYPNCDNSTTSPALNVNDFICFLNRFAASDPYANCDNSTQPPTLNVNDFICFLNAFAAGCT
jgi:hypothetical protein